MNKDIKFKLLIFTGVILVFAIIVLLLTHFNKGELDIDSVEYSFGGGYGTEITSATKRITITSSGVVTFSNDYDSSVERYYMSVEEAKGLMAFVNKRMGLFNEKVKEENNVADGISEYITVKLWDGTEYKFGGYMVKNKKFNEIEEKIKSIIDMNKYNDYINNIGKQNESIFDDNETSIDIEETIGEESFYVTGTIVYSYGGGFGTIADTATRYITIYPDGLVVLGNGYNSYKEKYNIDISKYNELYKYIDDRKSLFNEKPSTDIDIMDGGSQGLKIVLEDGKTKVYSGYMVLYKNDKFKEIKEKIYDTVGSQKIYEYDSKIK